MKYPAFVEVTTCDPNTGRPAGKLFINLSNVYQMSANAGRTHLYCDVQDGDHYVVCETPADLIDQMKRRYP